MPILELCAGYGGLGMAVEALTGDKVAYVAESDEAASLVLAHRFPNAPNIGDITTYDWLQLVGLVDIVTAGFSCQDISNAGPREGISGSRSRIWKDVAKAVGVLRPRLVFLENVAAIRSRGLNVVAEDLAAIGYDLWWTCLRASDVGGRISGTDGSPLRTLPTPAARDWKSGASNLHGQNSRPLNEVALVLKTPTAQLGRNGSAQHPEKRRGGGHGPTLDDEVSFLLPYSDSVGRDGRAGDEPEEGRRGESADSRYSPVEWWGEYLPAIRQWERLMGVPAPAPTETGPRGGRRLTASFAEWLMGIPGHVTDVPGLTRAQQLARIGNGAMPQQAYVAYDHLLQLIEEGRHGPAAGDHRPDADLVRSAERGPYAG